MTLDDVRYYVSGDADVMEDIGKVCCDVAMIPIGDSTRWTGNKRRSISRS